MQEEALNSTSAETYNLVTFRLEQEVYALPIEAIIKIISMVTITSIPRVHESVEGIINMRGAAVPVINLRRYLDVPEVPLGLHTPIILVQVSERTMGLIVDEVIDVQEIDGERIARLGDIMPDKLGNVPILEGIVHTPEGTILLLNIEQLFRPSQIEALNRVVDSLPESLVVQRGTVGDFPQRERRSGGAAEDVPPWERCPLVGDGGLLQQGQCPLVRGGNLSQQGQCPLVRGASLPQQGPCPLVQAGDFPQQEGSSTEGEEQLDPSSDRNVSSTEGEDAVEDHPQHSE